MLSCACVLIGIEFCILSNFVLYLYVCLNRWFFLEDTENYSSSSQGSDKESTVEKDQKKRRIDVNGMLERPLSAPSSRRKTAEGNPVTSRLASAANSGLRPTSAGKSCFINMLICRWYFLTSVRLELVTRAVISLCRSSFYNILAYLSQSLEICACISVFKLLLNCCKENSKVL